MYLDYQKVLVVRPRRKQELFYMRRWEEKKKKGNVMIYQKYCKSLKKSFESLSSVLNGRIWNSLYDSLPKVIFLFV